MRFAISIPQVFPHGSLSPHQFPGYLRGGGSAGPQESPLGSSPQLSPLEAMTYAASCTSTLRIGCTVFVTPLHSPVHLAKALASLDQMSGGRLEVGVGSGGPGRPFAAYGLSGERYIARFTEGVNLMK